jgi:hypothetical protein
VQSVEARSVMATERGALAVGGWSHLPRITRYSVELRAERAQRLPPMWTTALHGALDDALFALTCRCRLQGGDPRAQACQPDCPYAWLCEAPAREGDLASVQDRAPAPLVIAPERFDPRAKYTALAEGETITLRLALLGEVARTHAALVHAALQRCARTGLGIDPARPEGPRPSLTVERVIPVRVQTRPPPLEVVVETVTPLRLTQQGKVLGRLDATALWRSMRRRAEALARRYGGGSLGDEAGDAPFAAEVLRSEVVQVTRWSSRQKRRMAWPGVMGIARLHGEGVAQVWPLLEFVQEAQVGKGTSFGFGRLSLTAVVGDTVGT